MIYFWLGRLDKANGCYYRDEICDREWLFLMNVHKSIITQKYVRSLAGYVEALASKLGMQVPDLTPKQVDMWQTKLSSHMVRSFFSILCFYCIAGNREWHGNENERRDEEWLKSYCRCFGLWSTQRQPGCSYIDIFRIYFICVKYVISPVAVNTWH